MSTMTSPTTHDQTVIAWHDQTCGFVCHARAAHLDALTVAARITRHATDDVRAARLHDAVCQQCPAPHEHAARIAARVGL